MSKPRVLTINRLILDDRFLAIRERDQARLAIARDLYMALRSGEACTVNVEETDTPTGDYSQYSRFSIRVTISPVIEAVLEERAPTIRELLNRIVSQARNVFS